MCEYIFISTVGNDSEHERICVTMNHDKHSDVFVDGMWRPQ